MDLLGSLGAGQQPNAEEVICSRKGCRNRAHVKLLWNNPKIHTPERRKVWLACPEHEQWLEDYLRQRLLYRDTEPLVTGEGTEG
ncbi:hypothetical protein GCM10027417_09630 [Glutamicibacter endophyticus]|uniref:acetone carboxylase n=1 Tax=Glutamicibacter sp. PS TaxID=3075634 RepID=UPI00283EF5F7|nr:acetone carboxylase [Glutamicibacter sp. PS]MDR4532861.1 acetone carboxylase [Glutamicibacter sp. PS]